MHRVARLICLSVQMIIGVWAVMLPIRRELLDRGVLPAGLWKSAQGVELTLFGNGVYRLKGNAIKSGKFAVERFPEAPWISVVTLDQAGGGLRLHVRYDERAYRIEDVEQLSGAEIDFRRS